MTITRYAVLKTIQTMAPVRLQTLEATFKSVKLRTLHRYVAQYRRYGVIKDTREGFVINDMPIGFDCIDIRPLKNNGWKYLQKDNHTFGKWLNPHTGEWQDTYSALRFEALQTDLKADSRLRHEKLGEKRAEERMLALLSPEEPQTIAMTPLIRKQRENILIQAQIKELLAQKPMTPTEINSNLSKYQNGRVYYQVLTLYKAGELDRRNGAYRLPEGKT